MHFVCTLLALKCNYYDFQSSASHVKAFTLSHLYVNINTKSHDNTFNFLQIILTEEPIMMFVSAARYELRQGIFRFANENFTAVDLSIANGVCDRGINYEKKDQQCYRDRKCKTSHCRFRPRANGHGLFIPFVRKLRAQMCSRFALRTKIDSW